MPYDKSQAFDTLFKKFQNELGLPLTPDVATAFLEIYGLTVGYYLDCPKDGDSRDYWTIEIFRNWATESTAIFAREVNRKASAKHPVTERHMHDGASDAFFEISKGEYCSKKLPHCDEDREGIRMLGPVCTHYFERHPRPTN